MEKLSSKVLSREKWDAVKDGLKFFWLKKENQSCCYCYNEGEDAFLICCDNGKSLTYHSWGNSDDRSLFAKVVCYLSGLPDEEVQELISPDGLVNIIDEFYNNENN